jgi:putative ABC transport system ATP-binding protein
MIELKNACKYYTGDTYETKALNKIDFKVVDGDFVAVQGKSGSGKSTLLNIIGCMDELTDGELIIDGVQAGKLGRLKLDKLRREKMSFVFQSYELMDNYTIFENIELPLNVQKIKKGEKKSRVIEIMDRLGIADLREKYPNQISGGEKQRVAIARAYVSDKKYVLADEPTGALDGENTSEIMKIFGQLNQEGKTIILVTHDDDVSNYAKRVVRLENGRIV